MRMLLVNVGSSSLKLAVAEDGHVGYNRTIEQPPTTLTDEQWTEILDDAARKTGRFDVVVHRILHGGNRFGIATLVDDDVLEGIKELSDLAPLHQPASVLVLQRIQALLPHAVQIACFDTAFHSRMPAEAYTYAIPKRWREELGVRRYGFHGLAHEYNYRRTAELLGEDPHELRMVSAHLGSGASLAAIRDGHSVDTTMGFTPLEGLVMSTRSGTIDPAVPVWLVEHDHTTVEDVIDKLEHESGFLGLAGDSDMRGIISRAETGEAEAILALDVWAHRAAGMIAMMTAATRGIDALAFSGGIGEHGPDARLQICDRLRYLGVHLDPTLNAQNRPDTVISTLDSPIKVTLIETREDKTMVRQAQGLLWQLEEYSPAEQRHA